MRSQLSQVFAGQHYSLEDKGIQRGNSINSCEDCTWVFILERIGGGKNRKDVVKDGEWCGVKIFKM